MGEGRVLTVDGAWDGGFYELCFYYPPGLALHAALAALWSHPALEGPAAERDRELRGQPVVDVWSLDLDDEIGVLLFGTARLPSGTVVPCLSDALRYSDGEELVSFNLPLGSLYTDWPQIGAYPFGDLDQLSEWEPQLEVFLVDIARHVFDRAPFERALTGYELDADEPLRVPGELAPGPHDRGVLDVTDGSLRWIPPTRPWPDS